MRSYRTRENQKRKWYRINCVAFEKVVFGIHSLHTYMYVINLKALQKHWTFQKRVIWNVISNCICYIMTYLLIICFRKLSSKSSREDMCRLPTSFLLNIQSRVKQEVDMPQIQKCVTQYSSQYWCSVPNIRKLASVVPEKNVTEIILCANLPMSTIFKVA